MARSIRRRNASKTPPPANLTRGFLTVSRRLFWKVRIRRRAIQIVQPQKRKKKQSIPAKATDSNAVITVQTTSSTIVRIRDSQPRSSHCRSQFELPPGNKYAATESGHRNTADRNTDVDDHHHRDIVSL